MANYRVYRNWELKMLVWVTRHCSTCNAHIMDLPLSSFVSYLFLLIAQSVDCFYPGLMDYPCLPPPAQRMARARQLKRIIKKYSNAASMLLRQMGLHFSS